VITREQGPQGMEYRSEHIEYDSNSLPLVEESWDPQGLLTERYLRKYDEQGRLVHEILSQEGEELVEERMLSYDGSGRLAEERRRYLDGSVSRTTYSWDAEGNRTGLRCVDEEDEEEFREEARYAAGHHKVAETRWEYGEEVWTREWELDARGKVLRYFLHDLSDVARMEHQYAYDPEGRVTEERIYRNGRLMALRQQEYDEEGRVRWHRGETERGIERIAYAYDERGNQVNALGTDEEGNFLNEVKRAYDADGNILESSVRMIDPATGAERGYVLEYHYSFFSAPDPQH